MESLSDQTVKPRGRSVIVLMLFCLFAAICLGAIYYAGDLSKLQTVVSARESRTALRDVSDPDQLDQAIKPYPSNKLLSLLALANKDAIEIDAAARKLLSDVEPRSLPKLSDLGATSRSDLDALHKDLKTAESNATSFASRYAAQIKASRDQLENDARSLNVGDDRLSAFMAMIDEQHAASIALASKELDSRTEYYNAYEKCVALLVREFGIYRVTNGQFVFPFQSTADGYNRAATAMTAAANRASELDAERAKLRQSQLARWKAFAEH